MNYTLIVVADSTRGRFFSLTSSTAPLKEIHDLIHEASRLPNQELIASSPGSQPNTKASLGNRSHSLGPHSPQKTQEAMIFANEIYNYLIKNNANNEFINMILIAPPEFLGLLNKIINKKKTLKNKLIKEISKNLITASAEEIKNHLPFSIPGHLK